MTRQIVLLVLLSTGEVEQTSFAEEWPCLQAAREHNERGEQAWCVIQMPDDIRAKLEKYPSAKWSRDMKERLRAIQ